MNLINSTSSLLLAGNTTAAASQSGALVPQVQSLAGHKMVHIPGGQFIMGSANLNEQYNNCPPHWYKVSDFWMSETVVTVGQYRRVTGEGSLWGVLRGLAKTHVSWNDAKAYTNELSFHSDQNVRLPTEAEWEYAARGPAVNISEQMKAEQGCFNLEGLGEFVAGRYENYFFELGGEIYTDPSGTSLREMYHRLLGGQDPFRGVGRAKHEPPSLYGYRQYGSEGGDLNEREINYNRRFPGQAVWGNASGYGLKGMNGGVWEWCQDWYDSNAYGGGRSTRVDPRGPKKGHYKSLRSGSWFNNDPDLLRLAFRSLSDPGDRDNDIGIRLAVAPQDS